MPSWTSTGDDRSPANMIAWRDSSVSGILAGVCYGLLLRFSLGTWLNRIFGHYSGEMTLAFIVLGSMAVGFFAVLPSARRGPVGHGRVLLLSWLAIVLTCGVTALFRLEGAICIVMLLPIGLVLSLVGGLIGSYVGQRFRLPGAMLASVALLPVLMAPLESRLQPPTEIRTVQSSIRIHASAPAVWQNIQSVPAITSTELQPSWTHRIGFPRPVAAVLSRPGVGGVRTATFEHGLTFYETVTQWQPQNRLAFTIKADTAHIPPTTLDEHVTIGGPYFDVLDGEYRIEPLSGDKILLHLQSHQRLSTNFNNYAGLWSDAVMQNLQTSILQVIQHRCETRHAYNLDN